MRTFVIVIRFLRSVILDVMIRWANLSHFMYGGEYNHKGNYTAFILFAATIYNNQKGTLNWEYLSAAIGFYFSMEFAVKTAE